ncbi:MAG: putative alpha-E superfamily protein [Zhongshania marina]|jgi:uncharacterized alpha-E superfamily protein
MELLLFDRQNPRSLMFQLESLRNHLEDVEGANKSIQLSDDMRCILRATNNLLLTPLEEIAKRDEKTGNHLKLGVLLDQLDADLKAASQALADRYFDHAMGPQPVEMSGRGVS